MTDSPVPERRRFRRRDCKGEHFWRMVLNAPVRLLDVSHGGALLASDTAVPFCDGGRLRVRLAGMPFEADVRLVRFGVPDPALGPMRYELAAVFASMDQRSRDAMARFLQHPGAGSRA